MFLSNLKATCADFLNFSLQTFSQVLNTSDLMQVNIASKSSFVISIGSVERIHQLTDVKISPRTNKLQKDVETATVLQMRTKTAVYKSRTSLQV